MPKQIDIRLVEPGQVFRVLDEPFQNELYTLQRMEVASADGDTTMVYADVKERRTPLVLALGEPVEIIPPAPNMLTTYNVEEGKWYCLVDTTGPGRESIRIQLDLNDVTMFDGTC